MMTLAQKAVVYLTLIVLNIVFLVFFGLLAVVPIAFSIAAVMHVRRL